jgi:hypothetical protein
MVWRVRKSRAPCKANAKYFQTTISRLFTEDGELTDVSGYCISDRLAKTRGRRGGHRCAHTHEMDTVPGFKYAPASSCIHSNISAFAALRVRGQSQQKKQTEILVMRLAEAVPRHFFLFRSTVAHAAAPSRRRARTIAAAAAVNDGMFEPTGHVTRRCGRAQRSVVTHE